MHAKLATTFVACAVLAAMAASLSPAVAAGRAAGGPRAAGRAHGLAWKLVPTPHAGPAGASNELSAVSCVSARSCTAVGNFQASGAAARTLIESWNGTRWTIVPSPNAPHGSFDSLNGVSCVSARSCTAVGSFNPSQNAVSTLIESWNGTRWAIVPSPNRPHSHMLDGLGAVSCVSARSCTAVGSYGLAGQTLIESWNGTRWAIVPSPNR